MAYVDKINVQGTDYDIQDKRLPESDGTVVLNKNFQANGISGSEIVERMSGYVFIDSAVTAGVTITYAGVVKTGNKITFVVAGVIDGSSAGESSLLGQFTIPSAIGAKLFPIANTSLIDVRSNMLYKIGAVTNSIEAYQWIDKSSNTLLALNLMPKTAYAEANYSFRYEATFLLSDNLAQ